MGFLVDCLIEAESHNRGGEGPSPGVPRGCWDEAMNKMSEAKAGSCRQGEVEKGWGRFRFRLRLSILRLPFWGGWVLSWLSDIKLLTIGERQEVMQQDWTWPVWPALQVELRLGRLGLSSPGSCGRGACSFPQQIQFTLPRCDHGRGLAGLSSLSCTALYNTAVGQLGATWVSLELCV